MLSFLISIAAELEPPVRREAATEARERHDGWKYELSSRYLSFPISAKTMEEVSIPNLFPNHLIILPMVLGTKEFLSSHKTIFLKVIMPWLTANNSIMLSDSSISNIK